jgi:hypothetical protein
VYVADFDKAFKFAQDKARHSGKRGGLIKVEITFCNAKYVTGDDTGWEAEGYDACRAEQTSASPHMEWCVASASQAKVLRIDPVEYDVGRSAGRYENDPAEALAIGMLVDNGQDPTLLSHDEVVEAFGSCVNLYRSMGLKPYDPGEHTHVAAREMSRAVKAERVAKIARAATRLQGFMKNVRARGRRRRRAAAAEGGEDGENGEGGETKAGGDGAAATTATAWSNTTPGQRSNAANKWRIAPAPTSIGRGGSNRPVSGAATTVGGPASPLQRDGGEGGAGGGGLRVQDGGKREEGKDGGKDNGFAQDAIAQDGMICGACTYINESGAGECSICSNPLAGSAAAGDRNRVVKCGSGHPLEAFTARDGVTVDCDGCGARQPGGATLSSCRLCDYDICRACSAPSAADRPTTRTAAQTATSSFHIVVNACNDDAGEDVWGQPIMLVDFECLDSTRYDSAAACNTAADVALRGWLDVNCSQWMPEGITFGSFENDPDCEIHSYSERATMRSTGEEIELIADFCTRRCRA